MSKLIHAELTYRVRGLLFNIYNQLGSSMLLAVIAISMGLFWLTDSFRHSVFLPNSSLTLCHTICSYSSPCLVIGTPTTIV
ncbi:MAG: hypothetical protein OT477_12190 [Chloroflexi bacterium]|nr:hypothetical protein [Chloroflexota bacterium]